MRLVFKMMARVVLVSNDINRKMLVLVVEMKHRVPVTSGASGGNITLIGP